MLLFGLFYLQLHFGRTYVQYDLVEVVGLPTSTVMEASIKPQKNITPLNTNTHENRIDESEEFGEEKFFYPI